MQVERSETGQLYYLYSSNKGHVKLEQSEVFHIPGLIFDGLVGYSPIAMSKNAIGMAIGIMSNN